jgi:tetratricopeptide (TPR) repeat protein
MMSRAILLSLVTLMAAGAAASADSDDGQAAYQRGLTAEAEHRHQDAQAALDEALRLNPKHAEALLARGRVHAAQSQTPKALADLSAAIGLNPRLAEAYTLRAGLYYELGEYAKSIADDTAAIALTPDDADLYVDRSASYAEMGQFDKAVADLTKAVALRPKDASIIGTRGVEHLLWKKYDEGMADLRRAIALNGNDVGQGYRANRDIELSPEALAHGERQVAAMLRDRPPMAEHGDEAAFLRQWAARKFAGEDVGETIDWEPQPPTDSDAEHVAPTDQGRGRIMIDLYYRQGHRRGQPRTFEELWSRAVFELHNISLARHFVRLHDEAQKGMIEKRQFVFQMWKYEEQAMQLSRAFYVELYLPFAAKKKLATVPERWFASHWQAIEEPMLDSISRTAYPWRPYARQYDWQNFWRLYQEGRTRRALAILQEVAIEQQHPRDLSEVHLWIGRCQLDLREHEAAVEALTACLKLSPSHDEALELRARAYRALKKPDEAEADAARLRELRRRR